MVKRHQNASFGSAYAFPGGVLEAADARVHTMSSGMPASRANALLAVESGGLDYYSAAIRELFEESGVLLARHNLAAAELEAARAALNAASLAWDSFVTGNGLLLSYDQLHYFSFWITPVGLPKRYSARFFLAQMPAAQSAAHCGGELTQSCWMTATDILQARKDGSMKLPYVTRKTLKRIAQIASTQELLLWAQACGEKGVLCDQPAFAPGAVL